jgi:phenylalanyl-tRNA synthetase beta chain
MNLNISYNWLKEYLATKKSAQEFAKEISLCGPSVDHIFKKQANFEKVYVGKILEIKKHPEADRLQVCQVDIGKEVLNIVCGATNIREGQKVPVVVIGGRVGETEIVKAKLRGIESQGMLCSPQELGISDDHSGIYILPEYTDIGLPLEKIMPLEDQILDMEVTSNRPDAMSIVGVAREASAILGDKFLYHEPKPNLKMIKGEEKKFSVTVKKGDLCPRYQAIVMSGVKVEASPLWMQARLVSAGIRPINNLVDITNYILLELGQPMHVFDYDKLKGAEINVRLAEKNENILALDGKSYQLSATNLVIADATGPVAIAGVMGGELSAVSAETKTIVFESANFNSVSVRKTARTLNLHSESSNLYEKKLAPEGTYPALMRAIELAMELAGGKIASEIMDIKNFKPTSETILLSEQRVAEVLGIALDGKQIANILKGLGFEVHEGKDNLKVEVPWWRVSDIEGDHDLIEEIARIYGYHKLPSRLPAGEIPASYNANGYFVNIDKCKDILAGFGFSENYNYSFISERLIKNCDLKVENHVKVSNPLSSDFEYMRTMLAPGTLQAVADNENLFDSIKIFELSKVYLNRDNDLPIENNNLNLAVVSSDPNKAFFELKGTIEALLQKMNIKAYEMKVEKGKSIWHKNQMVELAVLGQIIGQIGLVSQETLHLFGIKKAVAMAELDFEALAKFINPNPVYAPIPKFPSIGLDLSMEINVKVTYGEVAEATKKVDSLIEEVKFLSEYRGDKVAEGTKGLAIGIVYRNQEKTLKLEEAQAVHKLVVVDLQKLYNIKVR